MRPLGERYAAELDLHKAKLPVVLETIPHIQFADAQELILEKHGVDVRGEPDLSAQDERWLGEWAQEEFGSDFLFVTGYPMAKRPFYTHADPTRPGYSNSFDLLFRGTELVTGGQRLHLYERLSGGDGRSKPAGRTVQQAIWRRFATACRPTAASPSAWNGC